MAKVNVRILDTDAYEKGKMEAMQFISAWGNEYGTDSSLATFNKRFGMSTNPKRIYENAADEVFKNTKDYSQLTDYQKGAMDFSASIMNGTNYDVSGKVTNISPYRTNKKGKRKQIGW